MQPAALEVTLGRGQLEHGHRARAAYDPARWHGAAQLDHAIPLVEKEHVDREPHAEGVDAAATRDQQAGAGALAGQQGEPEQAAGQVVRDRDSRAENVHPLEPFVANRLHRTDSGTTAPASPPRYWITTYAGVAIFAALTAYDMQKLKQINQQGLTGEAEGRAAIMGALSLYLDFINLFLFLLRIFGQSR
jgi:hypothetical protein